MSAILFLFFLLLTFFSKITANALLTISYSLGTVLNTPLSQFQMGTHSFFGQFSLGSSLRQIRMKGRLKLLLRPVNLSWHDGALILHLLHGQNCKSSQFNVLSFLTTAVITGSQRAKPRAFECLTPNLEGTQIEILGDLHTSGRWRNWFLSDSRGKVKQKATVGVRLSGGGAKIGGKFFRPKFWTNSFGTN